VQADADAQAAAGRVGGIDGGGGCGSGGCEGEARHDGGVRADLVVA
jgi:hypothetical protein